MRVRGRRIGAMVASLGVITGCGIGPPQTPVPTTYPAASHEAGAALAEAYVEAWQAADYEAMYATLDADVREAYAVERFVELHASFAEMVRPSSISASEGTPRIVGLPPAPRPAAFPAPEPTPAPSGGSPGAGTAATPSPVAADPSEPLYGPAIGLEVPLDVVVASERFGELTMSRSLTMVEGRDGWLVRWSPELLFPELGPEGSLRLDRRMPVRGRIVGADGTVWSETREDGARVYPQESLAGQAIGYVAEVTAEDLERLPAGEYGTGDVIGRSGLEAGAEPLLRGTPGWSLVAVAGDGGESVVAESEPVPGADLTVTLRPELQVAAEAALAPYGAGATAVVDPLNGDVWALASAGAFNPNAMTIGASLDGAPLTPPAPGSTFNTAVLGAYPAGSSFKPFVLAAALREGTVNATTLVTCPPTWTIGDTTFRNYEDHALPGEVTLAESMAFSCNTTYMPLAAHLYRSDADAFLEVLRELGFGQATGIGYVAEETGILPDDDWLREHRGTTFGLGDQIQLAIGQGAFLGTPLQLASAYATLGNGGTRWVPRIVTRAALPDGTVLEEVEPAVASRLSVSEEDLAAVTDTLEAVVTLPLGTGHGAFVGFGVPVAGKSGTAETGAPDPHAWFAAYAPADEPTIAVATVLPHIPLGTGGADAAPLVRQVMATHFAK